MDVPALQVASKATLRNWIEGDVPQSTRREGFRGLRADGKPSPTRPRGDTFTYHQGSWRGVVWEEKVAGAATLWMLALAESHDPAYAFATSILEGGQLYPDATDLKLRDEVAVEHELVKAISAAGAVARRYRGNDVVATASGYHIELSCDDDMVYTAKVRLSRADKGRGVYTRFGPEQAKALFVEVLGIPEGSIDFADLANYLVAVMLFIGDPIGERECLRREAAKLIER